MHLQAATTRIALLAGGMLLALTVATQGITLIGFVLGGTMGPGVLSLSLLASLGFAWWGASRLFPRERVGVWSGLAVLNVICLVGTILIAGQVMDISYDGQWYHSEAVLQLARGLNPLYKVTSSAGAITTDLYVQVFAKGAWYSAATVYGFTGNLEQAKAFNLILIIASLLIAWSTLRMLRLAHLPAAIFSLVLALNPESVIQAFAFMVDGQVASLLTILIMLLILYYRKPDHVTAAICILTIILLFNAKLNGALYLTFIGGVVVLWSLLRRRPGTNQLVMCFAVGALSGAMLFGYNPYMTQYARGLLGNGNLWYPYDDKILKWDEDRPAYMKDMGRAERILVSLFSVSETLPAGDHPRLKLPFTFSDAEIESFAHDTRTAGFGPWFSGLLLVILLLLLLPWKSKRHWVRLHSLVFLLVPTVVVSVLLTTEGWRARYAPQLWIIPVLLIALTLGGTTSRWLRYIAILGCAVLCINLFMVVYGNFSGIARGNGYLQSQFAFFKQQKEPILIRFGLFPIVRYRLDALDIPYVSVPNELPCKNEDQFYIYFSDALVCYQENSVGQ